MKNLLLLFMTVYSLNAYSQRTCGSHTLYEHNMATDENFQKRDKQIEDFTLQFMKSHSSSRMAAEEVIIPVVFHVVYNTSIPKENIPDAAIYEQLETLNKDFNALNEDILKVPEPFKPFIGNFKLKFVLANRDPNGNVTNGILRVPTTRKDFNILNNNIKYANKGGSAAWDTKSYLNIWVGDVKDEANQPGLLGYATFPTSVGSVLDGVVISYTALGKTGAVSPFNLGRTATHEVGHYFNLRHIWGNQNNCTSDDLVGDTPQQYKASSGNPTFPKEDQCTKGNGIMFMNYMDYSYDKSLIMFTLEQASRMTAALDGPRKLLKTSKGYVDEPKNNVDLQLLRIVYPITNICFGDVSPIVRVKSLGVNEVKNFTVSLHLNNILTQSQSWSGVMHFGDSVNIVFDPIFLAEGAYNVSYTVTLSGDENPDNNSKSQVLNVAGVTALPFNENFESLLFNNGVAINNPDGKITWTRSSINASTLGNYSFFINNFEYDPEALDVGYGEKDDIVLPNLSFSNQSNVKMIFDLSAAQYTSVMTSDNNWDSLQVLISTDCGKSFSLLYNKFAGSLITIPTAKTTFFTPSQLSQWRTETIDLSAYDGLDQVKLVIRNISNFENNIYIDNLRILGDVVTGLNQTSSEVQISLFPNPTNQQVTVRMGHLVSKLKSVEWINMMGQSVSMDMLYNDRNTLYFDFSNQSKGLYIARFLFEDGSVKTDKLLVQ